MERASDPGVRLRSRRAGDALVAAVVAAVVLAWAALDPADVSWPGWLILFGASAVLYFRRIYPVTVAVVTLAASVAYLVTPDPDGPVVLAFAVALYTLMAQGKVVPAVSLAAAAIVGTVYGEYSTDVDHLGDVGVLFFVGWLVAVMAVGGAVYNRRVYLREAAQRVRDVERGRDEELRRRTTEERLRIARELHDVLGHTISLINVQAAAALHRVDSAPEQAGEALGAIKDASGEALQELRSTLGVLRQVDEEAPTAPLPTLARVHDLVERSGTDTLAVHADVDGRPDAPIPPAVDLAGYRIVQEALTNVARHSGATSATVRVRYRPDDVLLEIDDDGHGAVGKTPRGSDGGATPGSGIAGMKERAEALGGELHAGPRPEGGFQVRARLPMRRAS